MAYLLGAKIIWLALIILPRIQILSLNIACPLVMLPSIIAGLAVFMVLSHLLIAVVFFTETEILDVMRPLTF
jgi:hypothetical protein